MQYFNEKSLQLAVPVPTSLAEVLRLVKQVEVFPLTITAFGVPFEEMPLAAAGQSLKGNAYRLYHCAVRFPGLAGSLVYELVFTKEMIEKSMVLECLNDAILYLSPYSDALGVFAEVAGPVLGNSACFVANRLTWGAATFSAVPDLLRIPQAKKRFSALQLEIVRMLNGSGEQKNDSIATRIIEFARILDGLGHGTIHGLQGYASWNHTTLGQAAWLLQRAGCPISAQVLDMMQLLTTANACLNFTSAVCNAGVAGLSAYRLSRVGLGLEGLYGMKEMVSVMLPSLLRSEEWNVETCPFEARLKIYGAKGQVEPKIREIAKEITENFILNLSELGGKATKKALQKVGAVVLAVMLGVQYSSMLTSSSMPYGAQTLEEDSGAWMEAMLGIAQDFGLHLTLYMASQIAAPFFAGITKGTIQSMLNDNKFQIQGLIEQRVHENIKAFLFNQNEFDRLAEAEAQARIEEGEIDAYMATQFSSALASMFGPAVQTAWSCVPSASSCMGFFQEQKTEMATSSSFDNSAKSAHLANSASKSAKEKANPLAKMLVSGSEYLEQKGQSSSTLLEVSCLAVRASCLTGQALASLTQFFSSGNARLGLGTGREREARLVKVLSNN